MNKIAAALLITLPLCLGAAFAADKAPTTQQSKMSTCSKDAKAQELKGA
ncbi:MAG: PsiF family protein, partial [Pseudomonadota bacterium]